jgi:hypothetical protein
MRIGFDGQACASADAAGSVVDAASAAASTAESFDGYIASSSVGRSALPVRDRLR